MSVFKVSVTPTRLQNQRKCEENRIPTVVVLVPFTPKSVVDFSDVPVTKTARRCLKIQNPTEYDKKLLLTKILKPEYNAHFSWTNAVLEANSEIDLIIEWTPRKLFSSMETIQFTDDRGFKKDVSVVLKSIMVKNTVKRMGLSGTKSSPKPKLKSPSPKKCIGTKPISPVGVRRRSFSANSIHVRKFQQTSVEQASTSRFDQIFDSFDMNEIVNSNNNKENHPTTPPNASKLFDQIQFTPITGTKSKAANKYEYLASCPTPASVPRYDNSLKPSNFDIKGRKLELQTHETHTFNSIMQSNKSNVTTTCETPKSHYIGKKFEPEIYSTVSRNMQMIEKHETLEVMETRVCYEEDIFINKTFEFVTGSEQKQESGDSISLDNLSTETYVKTNSPHNLRPSTNQMLSVTQPLSSPQLSIIDEEDKSDDNAKLAKTYNLIETKIETPEKHFSSDNLPRSPYIPTPLRKIMSMHDVSRDGIETSQAHKFMKCAQGSMPNLNENGARIIDSIENNRFFPSRSPSETERKRNLDSNIVFSEKEICAQSSLFNLNEPTPSKRCRTFSEGRIERRDSLDKVQQMHKPVRMIITPPRNKLSHDDSLNSRAQSIRSTNWGRSIDKMIKPMHSLVLKRKPSVEVTKSFQPLSGSCTSISSSTSSLSIQGTPRKNKARRCNDDAPRVPLFDPDLYYQAFVNPDPFAATTTCDPFLSATFYLDQRAVDEHEKQFKKWLNALVTVPEDIETDHKIDLGKLFQDVKNKELQYAQTKEKVSSKYFTKYRMISLRKVAFDLYRSTEMQLPITKIMQLIEKKQLAIRSDRNLHLDLVLQRNILELLLSFNPLWLRITLEIMFNEEIPMTSNSDIYSLSAFIINRLFRARFSEAKHSKSFTYSQNYAEQIKASALKYILILVLFLDKAKEKRIIKHNPCLFARNSKFKETREVLIHFSSSLVANLGDITKYLKRVGYVLTHKQTYLDEFDYAFKNLAIDLRDGVRLTRVMEIILLRDGLSKGLRAPAISRLQKVHNVEIALTALAEADFDIMGDITAKDIVEGHREKTLSLIWQIIYKFRAPRFNAAATTIQKWWRHNYLKVVINRRVTEKVEKRRLYSAIRIQSFVRSYLSRKRTRTWILERRTATRTIQTYTRRYLCRKRFLLIKTSIRRIETWYRNQVITRAVRNEFLTKRSSAINIQNWYRRIILARKLESAAPIIRSIKTTAKLRHDKAVFLQRLIKAYLSRKRFRTVVMKIIEYQRLQKDRHFLATRIKSYYKMYVQRKRYVAIRNNIIKIQTIVRAKLARDRYHKLRTAVINMQRCYRNCKMGKNIRNDYVQLRKSTILIQQKFRANRQMIQKREEYLKIVKSCVTIQNWRRSIIEMRIARLDYVTLRTKTITIQKHFRGKQEMKKLRNEFLVLRDAAIKIQQRFRARCLMKKQQEEYIKLRKACVCFQSNYRSIMERRRYLLLKSSVICIQQHRRAMLDMRNERNKYLAIQKSVLFIQRKFRGKTQMKMQKIEFTKIRESTVVLQRRLKACLAMKKQREMYILLRSSAITLQVQFRALREMRQCRQQYITIRRSTITIQKYYRRYLVMREVRENYLQIRSKYIVIQSVVRKYIQRRQYLTLRKSAITLQTQWRAISEMRKQRSAYLKLQSSVTAVQQRFRANVQMQTHRIQYLTLRSVTITIQQKYRALILMRKTRFEYNVLRSSVVCIQHRWRAQQLMIAERDHYNKLRTSAVKIQEYYRGIRQMRKDRQYFETRKILAVIIQTWYRGYIERRNYQIIRKSIILIQTKRRAILAMREARTKYLQTLKSIIFIQRRFRANKQMVAEHNNFLEIKQATNILQQRWKAQITMRQVRTQYILIRSSTITIQTYVRATLAMRYERQQYMLIRKSTICIQRYIRRYQIMKRDRESYLNTRNAVVKVQALYRSLIQRRYYTKLQRSVVLVQTRYRALLQMRVERHTYITMKTSVTTIQQFYRGYIQMKHDQNAFKTLKSSTIRIQSHVRRFIQQRNYKKLKASALVVQNRYRALREMRRCRFEYHTIQKSVLTIQNYYQNWVVMRQIRFEFIRKRNAAVTIQSFYRGAVQRRRYIKIITSVRIIQIRFKAMRAMKIQRSYYQSLIKSTILIQRQYRSIRTMRTARSEYLVIRSAAITIQQRYRAQILMKYTRNQYLLIRAMVICIQKQFRAKQLMIAERLRFMQIQHATRIIQQRYRATRLMEQDRDRYLQLRKSILLIQSRYRGNIARERYIEMWNDVYSPEAIEKRKQNNAAGLIQKIWRGYRVRKRQPKKLNTILKKLQSFEKHEPIKFGLRGLHSSCRMIHRKYTYESAYPVLVRLDRLTRLVPHLFVDGAEFLATFCNNLMAMAIRSEPDKITIELCGRIMLNLARFEPTTELVYQVNYLATIAQTLLRWCDKESGIFNTLCTLVWVFIHCPRKNRQIRKFMTTDESRYTLRETKKLVLRKQNMRKKIKAIASNQPEFSPNTLPNFAPDFGVVKGKPYVFVDSVFALDVLLEKLEIQDIL